MTVKEERAVKSSKMEKNNNQYQRIIQESSQAKYSCSKYLTSWLVRITMLLFQKKKLQPTPQNSAVLIWLSTSHSKLVGLTIFWTTNNRSGLGLLEISWQSGSYLFWTAQPDLLSALQRNNPKILIINYLKGCFQHASLFYSYFQHNSSNELHVENHVKG